MQTNKSVLTGEEKRLMDLIDARYESIEKESSHIVDDYLNAKGELKEITEKLRAAKAPLSDLAEMKAAIASPKSRDKYFPELTKSGLLAMIEGKFRG